MAQDPQDPDAGRTCARVTLPAAATLADVRQILQDLRALDPADGNLQIDAGPVTRMSGPLITVLLAAIAEWSGKGAKVEVQNASSEFTDAFSDLGFFADVMKMDFAT